MSTKIARSHARRKTGRKAAQPVRGGTLNPRTHELIGAVSILIGHVAGLTWCLIRKGPNGPVCQDWATIATYSSIAVALHVLFFVVNPTVSETCDKQDIIVRGQVFFAAIVGVGAFAEWRLLKEDHLLAEISVALLSACLVAWATYVQRRAGMNSEAGHNGELFRQTLPLLLALFVLLAMATFAAARLTEDAKAGFIVAIALATQIGHVLSIEKKNSGR